MELPRTVGNLTYMIILTFYVVHVVLMQMSNDAKLTPQARLLAQLKQYGRVDPTPPCPLLLKTWILLIFHNTMQEAFLCLSFAIALPS